MSCLHFFVLSPWNLVCIPHLWHISIWTGPFQVSNSHVWLVATILNGTDLNHEWINTWVSEWMSEWETLRPLSSSSHPSHSVVGDGWARARDTIMTSVKTSCLMLVHQSTLLQSCFTCSPWSSLHCMKVVGVCRNKNPRLSGSPPPPCSPLSFRQTDHASGPPQWTTPCCCWNPLLSGVPDRCCPPPLTVSGAAKLCYCLGEWHLAMFVFQRQLDPWMYYGRTAFLE